MSKQAKGLYNDILDSTRHEYERAMWGRTTTDDLDIHGATAEQGRSNTINNFYGDNHTININQQDIDDDMGIDR